MPQQHTSSLFVILTNITFFFFFWSSLLLSLTPTTLAAKVISKSHLCSKEEWQKNDADIAKLMSIGQFGRRFPENSTEIDLFWFVLVFTS